MARGRRVNRGGAPPKPPELKQGRRVFLTFTESEYAALRALAAPFPVGSYARGVVVRHLKAKEQAR